MTNLLEDKTILLGVTGSIAAYKAVDLASKLMQAGAQVDTIVTENAAQFVTPLTFRSITHRPVITNLFDLDSEDAIEHVALSQRADILVVAPASAHTLAKLALGLADNALTAVALATSAPLLVVPAMDANMWEHPTVQEHIRSIQSRGGYVAGPASGRLASGLLGRGRMLEPWEIEGHIRWILGQNGDLKGRKIVVSAGGTQEPIDPVRVITNHSSGKMGFAVAEAARDRGAEVVLVTAPTKLERLIGVTTNHVTTVEEMRTAILESCAHADALVMAAAVSDYRTNQVADQKIKKHESEDLVSLQMVKTPDFFSEVPSEVLRVGFAAETENLIENAKSKIDSKNLSLIAANDVTREGSGFGTDTNQVTLIDKSGRTEELPLLSKYEVGHRLLDRIVGLLK